ncbi:hypothetical protein [Lentzea cavernae]|uniref:Uncharacterized protein n=1 Tax=Lentzea cavernae TaxID=2020703 RepID=A0ABQ3MNH8_9PSEU|nr:hypothetical protein [Lentzea cavernae]GHH55094.1 hypothetical protein GCM10017774_71120 [Lentzea cavernae]
MLLRAVVGAVTGAVAGGGFLVTLTLTTRYCNGGPSRALCGELLLVFPLQFLFWSVVAGMLLAAGFRFLRQRRGWYAAGAAPVLWVLLLVATYYVIYEHLDLYQAERGPVITTAMVITACVAHAVAALAAGRNAAQDQTPSA